MKVRMQDCKNCGKQYGATNGNQSYCCNVCRQQAYYKRHGIDRSIGYVRPFVGENVNPTFTEIVPLSDKNDVNKAKEITPAEVMPVTPLIQHTPKNTTHDNFGAILEQMNKTHQAQMEAMETRLKLSFAQTLHEQELNAKADVISRLQKEIKDMENKSSIDTGTVLGGLSNIIAGIDIKDLLKAQA